MTAVTALLLAAGTSSRFGPHNKLLTNVAGEPMLLRSLATLKALLGEQVLVVLGHQADRLAPLLGDTPHVVNPDYEQGMGSSIATGVNALPQGQDDAVLIALADQVALTEADYCRLLDRYILDGRPVAARYQGRLGVPALFTRDHFPRLGALTGDQGARRWLKTLPDLQPVDLPRAALDIDTPADLHRPVPHSSSLRSWSERALVWRQLWR
ncbi:NTP transferase domain-containing protein [Ferrimonas balearica]|uniref:nucleotidyltransferase family protein n=1 Tax=Ferrimonas balearica TaxID=44012 RepID=UPI001C996F72|nr:nucleotidyltransferase family protein [Ferrimonas balearica]MBY5993188.1 nucleotidyltransferase family protein [Ferrimonas balearica]